MLFLKKICFFYHTPWYFYFLETTTKVKSVKLYDIKSNFILDYLNNRRNLLVLQRIVANIVLKDLIHLVLAWRQLRGYPAHGSTTHTNAKTARKNKLLLNFRVNQFNTLFGQKKRNIYPTLVKAEYTNRLWFYTWFYEWYHASFFAKRMAKKGHKAGSFNPALLADHQTNGYTRVGKAAKIGKAKKLVKVFTIGVPLFFTRYIYYTNIPRNFPVRLQLRDDVNKKLGKKFTKRKKKCYKKISL